MLSSSKVKLIQSLNKKKYRQKYNLFVVEGIKNIKEFVFSNFLISNIYTTEPIPFMQEHQYQIISHEELKKISFLKTPHNALALVELPDTLPYSIQGIQIALDSIQDPGNLGTIIRLADWYGIEQIFCSETSVDVYNPKVVQATMGSLARVQVNYTDLKKLLTTSPIPVCTTDMDGENIYTSCLPQEAFLVMGNEGNGISEDIKSISNLKLTIPRFGKKQKTESLNVAISTGIILSEFFSQKEKI
ncbi:RNA methyltransferase [Apibacter adventoris]|uniref:RNA methyltransferase n=1 Tax=Apibacter adventoris TaxID=1679466 RepID=A0A2S8AF68_9FLAO|nr:RNA methyltransferase [Apibacter adventoris]PQL94282.1 RNA methyltransferase [Apibacter adventoris]